MTERYSITYGINVMSYRQIFYQIIFATKNRCKTITEAHCEELYKYIWGIIKNKKCKLYRINGTEDHIHIFSDLHPSISLADYIRDIKASSSIWMKNNSRFPEFRGWQESYGAFTYSIKERSTITSYVKNQKEHHKIEPFYDEYKRLLIENGVAFDEKYLL
ncbi:IS200/IS605 family transposase [Niabella soli]|nr:IS200/IS605 family transposase [Niabella soli]